MQKTLAKEIIYGSKEGVAHFIEQGEDVNAVDEYGFTPLIEAAIVNNADIAELLLQKGAVVDYPDTTGRAALHWAADSGDLKFCKLLLEHSADANLATRGRQPPLVHPYLRDQAPLKQLFYQYGADLNFAKDYINTKLIGHRFELRGQVHIIDPKENYILLDYEGFFFEFTASLIQNSLGRYKNNFAAKHLHSYFEKLDEIIAALQISAELIKYQHYQTKRDTLADHINHLISHDLLMLPISYAGHAITYVKYSDIFVKIDRGEYGKKHGTVIFYKIQNKRAWSKKLVKHLLYEKLSEDLAHEQIVDVLGLQPLMKMPLSAQITGNCSWANVEATVPVMLFLLFVKKKKRNTQTDMQRYMHSSLDFYYQWREWDKDRALDECIASFTDARPTRKKAKAALLGSILFYCCDYTRPHDLERAARIIKILSQPDCQFVIQNYLKVFYKYKKTPGGENLMHLLDLISVENWLDM